MKCALVIPSWVPGDIFPARTAGSQINYWQPLGTLYVASALQAAGHEVQFYNGAFISHEAILRDVVRFGPRFIGIYSTTFGWSKAKKTAADLKSVMKGRSFLCVGGPYPIAAKEHCLTDAESCFDAVVTGEGEVTVPEMIKRLESGKGLDGVAGVIWKNGKEVVSNIPRALVSDLDSLAFPARELLGDSNLCIPPPATYRRRPVAVVMTSRGCNRKCIYCFQMDKERKSGIRYRSVGNVLREIELCLDQGYREIKFIDDTFAADYDRAMTIVREIKSRRLDFTWFASACVNQVDGPLLKAFREAGCWAILFGAESGVQKNLNMIRKGTTLEQIRNAVRNAKEAGIRVSTPFLFGIPGETFEEGLQTIEFAIDLDPDIANFHAITPFPGTYLYDNLDRYGTLSNELTDFTYQGAAFVPYTMTRDEILKLRQIAFKRFYSRPSFILKRVLELRNINDIKVAAKSARSLFWLHTKRDIFGRSKKANP